MLSRHVMLITVFSVLAPGGLRVESPARPITPAKNVLWAMWPPTGPCDAGDP